MALPKLSIPSNDLALEKSGVWEPWEGAEYLIARGDTPAMAAIARQMADDKRERLKRAKLTEEEAQAVRIEWIARHVLRDWRGVKNIETGELVPYTPELGIELLSNPEYRDFYEFVLDRAGEGAKFRRRVREEALGNS